jgi:hypothetical protein
VLCNLCAYHSPRQTQGAPASAPQNDDKPKDGQPREGRGKKDGPVVQVRAWSAAFEWDANVSVQLDLPCSTIKNASSGKDEIICTSKNKLQEIVEPQSVLVSTDDFQKMYW